MTSKEDCLEILRNYAKDNEGKLSRDLFRNNGDIPETIWIKYFGTWQEYKRQAGLVTDRQFNNLSNQIARHASTDNLEMINIEKSSYEENYLRPSGKRFQTILIGSDVHDLNADPFWIRLFLDTAKRVQPEKIILNGDIFDNSEFSKYNNDPREFLVKERIKWVRNFFYDIRYYCPNSELNLVEGNHETRLVRMLQMQSPQLMALLSDVHGMTVKDLFKLTEFNINYYARADLRAFNKTDINNELSKNYIIVNDQLLCHHFPEGKSFGYPGCSGHHHKHHVWPLYSPQFGSYEWHQTGCGHRRLVSYTDAQKWSVGFLLAHLDTHKKRTQFEYIDCSNETCFIGGKFYQRNKEEMESYI